MDEQTLEPCPWCGGPASLKADVDYGSALPNGLWWVQCDPCDTFPESAWCKPKDEAIAAWNSRAAHSVIAGKVAELTDVAEEARKALEAMMRAWFDYHDAHSLTQPVTGAAGNAFDLALAARERIDAALAPYPERR